MKIQCDNGLCDRLRFIFSYLHKIKNQKLIVCWKINRKCNGHFLDIFKKIENLEFTDNDSNVDINDWKPAFDIDKENKNIYKRLKLIPEIKFEIIKLKQKMGKYVSIQIRRTDRVLRAKQKKIDLTPDQDFIKFAKKTNLNIFLATDCCDTQNKFKEEFKNRLFWFEKIKNSWNFDLQNCHTEGDPNDGFRTTSLKTVAIDLYTCIYSNDFMGTNLSGMSQFIEYNRKWNKIKLI